MKIIRQMHDKQKVTNIGSPKIHLVRSDEYGVSNWPQN